VIAQIITPKTRVNGSLDSPGDFAQHGRTVDSRCEWNGKKRPEATSGAATSAGPWASSKRSTSRVPCDFAINRSYQKPYANRLTVMAIKPVAHELAMAC
jgi:hypothetical protein